MYKYFNTKTKFENFTTKTYNGLPLVCFWLLGLNITGFVIKIIFTLIFGLIFIAFIIYFIFKLYIFTKVFIQNLAIIFYRNFLYILFRILPIFIFYCFVFSAIIFLTCIFVNLLHVFRNIVNLFYMLTLTNIFLTGIYSMLGWTATARHVGTRKRNTKRLKHTGNYFKKNLQLIGVC